jgi:hypothetical protein
MKRTIRPASPLLRLCVIFFFALVTVSCATGGGHGEQKAKKLLKEEIDQFNSDIRWQDYQHAEVFVPKSQVDRYWSETDRMKRDIRLTDFEVRNVEFSEDVHSARVLVHFQYWSLESPILRSVTVHQKWRFDELRKVWHVTNTGFGAITRTSSGE